jgi:hypothetical protein
MKLTMVSFFWGSLSRLEWICLNSFVQHGFDVHLYTCEKMRVPVGVELKDAGKFIDCSDIKFYGKGAGEGMGSPSLTSNIFRYKMLASKTNACWIDTDMICLSNFAIDGDYLFAYERPGIVNSAILGVGVNGDSKNLFTNLSNYVNNPFKIYWSDHPKIKIRKLLAILKRQTDWEHVPWGVTGPLAVTSILKKMNLIGFSSSSSAFYPVAYANADTLFEPMSDSKFQSIFLNSKTCHLWNEILRRKGLDKNTYFHPDSPYERFIQERSLDSGWL